MNKADLQQFSIESATVSPGWGWSVWCVVNANENGCKAAPVAVLVEAPRLSIRPKGQRHLFR